MKPIHVIVNFSILLLFLSAAVVMPTAVASNADQEIAVPHLIKFAGAAKYPDGSPRAGSIAIKFSLYAAKEGGDPLWNEIQMVQADTDGNYSIYLGASEKTGVPLELFSTEKARWIGVQVEGEEEQARILFVAVPYALKALDAETVGGKPLSSFVLYEDLEKLAEDSTGQGGEETDEDGNATASNRTAGAIKLLKSTNLHGGDRERSMQAVINGAGVANALAKFSDSANITASVLSEVGGNIGVGTLTPYAKLTFAYNSTTTDPIAMMDSAVGGRNWRFGGGVGAPGAFTIRDDTAGANRFSITSNGNIGVGTASPIAKFSFEYDSSAVDPIAMVDTAVGGRSWRFGGGVGAAGTFTIRDDTAGANRLSISSGGNVGIGTTSPSSKLTVAGDIESSTGFRIGGSSVFSIAGTDNLFVGSSAGASTSGGYNSFFGMNAGLANTTGNNNAFIGSDAGYYNTTGADNSFFGSFAGYYNTAGNMNSFLGSNAGYSNTTGNANSFFGAYSGQVNTTGSNNSLFGYGSGRNNTTGYSNSFFGNGAGFSNTAGYYNSFFGAQAGESNTTGSHNAFVGYSAGRLNTEGSYNSFFGKDAGASNTTGSSNALFGTAAGYFNTTGHSNSFFGIQAGYSNTTGTYNSFVGSAAGASNTTGGFNSNFGAHAGRSNTTGNFNAFVGYGAGDANTEGSSNSFFGHAAGASNATGNANSFFGSLAGTLATGSYNAFFGKDAGASTTTGERNSFFGYRSGFANSTGYNNSFFGHHAGFSQTTGLDNAFFGLESGYSNTTGFGNSFFGKHSGFSHTTGNSNTFFGLAAGYSNTSGGGNVFVGALAGQSHTTGNGNSYIGYKAGNASTIGYGNTAVGYVAGINNPTGSNNVYINNEGVNDESNVIRIGNVTATALHPSVHIQTFIAGIANATVSGSTVFIDSNGQLGIATSSSRFKEDIRDMGDASSSLLQLRPVTFHYKPEYSKSAPSLQYGLIAEEVAEVYPDLVQYDNDGKPFTVQYQVLNSMLLNEVQKQHAALEEKDAEINALNARLTALERLMNRLMTQTSENREGK